MRFLADMGVSMKVVSWLRSEGHDVWHLREKGLHRLPDREIFRRASEEGRVVLTFDLDFSEIVALSGAATSVIVFRLQQRGTEVVIRRLARVLEESAEKIAEGAIVTVEDWRHRLRPLPLRPVD